MRAHRRYPDKAARVARVRELRAEGKSLGQIEYLAGVSRSTAYRWLSNGGDGEVQPRFDYRAWRASRERRSAVG
jgi:transposase